MSDEQKKEQLAILDDEDRLALNEESKELIKTVINEHDPAKQQDLAYLFNLNQNKKTMIRVDKLSNLQDKLTDQLMDRVANAPDNMSNQDLINAMKVTQDMAERGMKQINGINDVQPMIQINQQDNSTHVTGVSGGEALSRESREKVKSAVLDILKAAGATAPSDNTTVIEVNAKEQKEDDGE